MTDEAMSPLRRRMIEDMTIRKFAPKTQHDYVRRVKNFAAFLGRSGSGDARCGRRCIASGVRVQTKDVRCFGRSCWPQRRRCSFSSSCIPAFKASIASCPPASRSSHTSPLS
jgi:hypothetical protein